jgi:hypothetical protein
MQQTDYKDIFLSLTGNVKFMRERLCQEIFRASTQMTQFTVIFLHAAQPDHLVHKDQQWRDIQVNA